MPRRYWCPHGCGLKVHGYGTTYKNRYQCRVCHNAFSLDDESFSVLNDSKLNHNSRRREYSRAERARNKGSSAADIYLISQLERGDS